MDEVFPMTDNISYKKNEKITILATIVNEPPNDVLWVVSPLNERFIGCPYMSRDVINLQNPFLLFEFLLKKLACLFIFNLLKIRIPKSIIFLGLL
jgi:hypothetical protein